MASRHPCFCYCTDGAGITEMHAGPMFPTTFFYKLRADRRKLKKYFFVILKK